MDDPIRLDPVSRPDDDEAIVTFLASQCFPFHVQTAPTRSQARERLERGDYDGPDHAAFWVVVGDRRAGLAVLEDLRDDTPLFDLRLAEDRRGQGLGAPVLRALTWETLRRYPHVRRFEGVTRWDNVAMRRTFRRAGWVKEAHYRSAWPVRRGQPVDTIGYAILRRDLEQGTTTPVPWDEEP